MWNKLKQLFTRRKSALHNDWTVKVGVCKVVEKDGVEVLEFTGKKWVPKKKEDANEKN